MKLTKTLALGIAPIILLAGACGSKKPQQAVQAAANEPVAITTAAVTTKDVPATIDETGTFVADELSDVAPNVAGRIVATPVNVGQMVQQGQVIAQLDSRDAQLKLSQMQGAIEESKASRAPVAVANRHPTGAAI